jgi:hypothetical protein
MRTALIETYFAAEVHPLLRAQGDMHLQSFLYSQKLIEKPLQQVKESPAPGEDYQAVVRIYDHRCGALRTVRCTENVRRLRQWTCDQGLLGVSTKYLMLLSGELRSAHTPSFSAQRCSIPQRVLRVYHAGMARGRWRCANGKYFWGVILTTKEVLNSRHISPEQFPGSGDSLGSHRTVPRPWLPVELCAAASVQRISGNLVLDQWACEFQFDQAARWLNLHLILESDSPAPAACTRFEPAHA